MKKNTKKRRRKSRKSPSVDLVIQLSLALLLLLFLTIGATFAYFKVTSSGNFSSTSINTTVEDVGSVVLSNTNSNLSLNLTALNMVRQDSDINFYASNNGKTTEPTTEVLGTITVNGNGTFRCEYDLIVTANGTNNMYTAFQGMSDKSTGQIILQINGISYDFNTANLFPINRHFVVTGLEEGSPEEITTLLKIVNKKNIDQSDLAGTDISISFSVDNFTCIVTQ